MRYRYLAIILVFIIMLTACSQDSNPAQPIDATMPPVANVDIHEMPHLQISVNPEINAYNRISDDFPDGLTEFTITYVGINNVIITLDNEQLPLEDALTSGKTTPEEIIAYAQLDAKNNDCYEYAVSTNGLTKLVYNYYDQFDLVVFYDVYETPDGKQHLIKELNICPYYDGRRTFFGFGDLDQENWGLTIKPVASTQASLTLSITQSGGQQFGALRIMDYAILTKDDQRALEVPNVGVFIALEDSPEYYVQMNGDSNITLNWFEDLGELPPGNYTIYLQIMDVYDESQVHPLARNFQDLQGNYIDFTIP